MYDVTGKSRKEINEEVLRLASLYESVEIEDKDGRTTITCRGKYGGKGIAG